MMLFNLHAPKISLIYAGVLSLFYVYLSFNVINQRRLKKVGIGHDTDQNCSLFRSVRIHANFAEYVPLMVLLLVLDEVTGRSKMTLHAFGILMVLGRVGHYIGITRSHGTTPERFIGMILTFTTIIVLGVLLIIKGVA